MKRIKVLLADDHAIVRAGLRALLQAAGDMNVIGEAENGQQAVQEAERLRPDVVLLDLAMPLLNGVEAARQIAHEVPAARVLILSNYSDAQHVQQAVEAGATGYLMKETASNDCLQAIRETCNGNAVFSPPIARILSKQWQNRDLQSKSKSTAPSVLTSRQTEVLQFIAEGYSTEEMARLLSVSIKTVEKHRQSLMDKLDIHEIASLTRYAVSSGVVESNDSPIRPVTRLARAVAESAPLGRLVKSKRSPNGLARPAPAPRLIERNHGHSGIVERVKVCGAETLLVVDDDETVRQLEVQVLRRVGYRVLEAKGPVEAMQLAAATPTIHLLLTDFQMPEANGWELTRQFRQVHPEAPVLMVSGSSEAIYGRAEYPDRFAVLPKPFTREELVDGVTALLSASTTWHAVASL
jgi:DNA-binding NarL/FixJ family response regulator